MSDDTSDSSFEPTWTLWREDDNGARAAITRGLSRAEAESRLAELEARGHKQYYWLEPDAESKSENAG